MTEFWNFTDNVDQDTDELRIDGDIVDDGDAWLYDWLGMPCASPNKLRLELKKREGKRLNVWINSYGGSVFAGAGLYNALKAHKGTVNVIVDGIAASAASVVAMAGDTISISPVGMLMIHNPIGTLGYSEAREFRQMADMLDKVKDTILNAYVLKTRKSRDDISQMMDDETYMTAGEAVRSGFADKIHDVDETTAGIVNCAFRRCKALNADDDQLRRSMARIAAKLTGDTEKDTTAEAIAAAAKIAAKDAAEIAKEKALLSLRTRLARF